MSQLTKDQKEIFEALHKDRVEDYKVFSKRNYGGLFKGVIEKYPESAHFVFELLQNADDANATEVSILLKQDRLLFKHNGTKHFDVVPPNSDLNADINSITGIGDSTKAESYTQNKIGKFGVGFKSVFQYTNTPEIYDDTFKFKIENYIIPTLLDHDYEGRNEGETLFVFPFSSPKDNYEEIKNKIKHLPNPLLFLNNVKKIVWQVEDVYGVVGPKKYFEKKKRSSEKFDDVFMDLYDLTSPHEDRSLFLFSRNVTITEGDEDEDEEVKKTIHSIYVGFYYDEKEKKLETTYNPKVYCFFPTKESFKTCFLLHAPFLLTDNRQNIKPSEPLNTELISLLAKLSARAVVLLRDYGVKNDLSLINENIVDILPKYDFSDILYSYSNDSQYKKIFQDTFLELVKNEPLFISRDGSYLLAKKSFKTVGSIYDLVNKKQFELLTNNKGADFLKWDLIQKISKREDCEYYKDIKEYRIEDFADDITPGFMEAQPKNWVLKFYTFVREEGRKFWVISKQTKGSSLAFRKAPIILTQQGDWVAPFTGNDLTTTNVFLPVDKGSSIEYNFINWDYLKEESAKKLFEAFEIKTPDRYSYIRNVILEKYKDYAEELDDDELREDFKTIFNYFREIKDTEKEEKFIKELKRYYYLVGSDGAQHPIGELYADDAMLKKYFGSKSMEIFIKTDFYYNVADGFQKALVKIFLDKLVTQKLPSLEDLSFNRKNYIEPVYKQYLQQYKDYNEYEVSDYRLSGFENAVQKNIINRDISVYLWNEVIPAYINKGNAELKASNNRRKYWDPYTIESSFHRELTQYPWLFNRNGKLIHVDDAFVEELDIKYDLGNGLIDFLGITKRTIDLREKYNVTNEEQKTFETGSRIRQAAGEDVSEDEIIQMIEERKKQKRAQKEAEERRRKIAEESENIQTIDTTEHNESTHCVSIEEKLEKRWEEKKSRNVNKPHSSTFQGDEMLFADSGNGIEESDDDAPFFNINNTNSNLYEKNIDDTTRAEKNLKAKDTTAQAQAENAKDMVDMMDLLNQTQKYTFKWFKIYMELMHDGQDNITERRVQIDFSKYELICSDKIVHLIEPTKPVPAWICDAEKFSISALSNGKTAKIDGLIVKTTDDSIDISVELNNKMLNDLNQAKKIRVDAVDNTNIINSLETRFLQLEKDDDFDMNANLPENISFIYGPPGTGKTTELVKRVHDLLEKEPNAKILVLTPTNKAADVVAIKMSNDDVCEGGLARYGATESLYLIEEIGCVTNRDTTDMNGWHNILVATAARYAYDFVQPDDTAICDYPWDYIFIDEASMIDILTITYILYKGANAKKIIISGDPKQIQPVVKHDLPEYNIYNMVGLQGFASAIYDYKRFPVEGLMMQHRSIPVIGDMVSNFAYDGLVDSDPKRAPMKPLKLDGIPIKNINFLGFDIAELDEIKGLYSINNSAFHLYSVIFTYNMIEYTIKQIEKNHPNQYYSIGVVCAYRAQSDAIKNMLENRPIDTAFCKVTCGTVHSFQGDECDIMFIVLNPPPECTKGTHVNNVNIINVAMSRARDYLFFVLPKATPNDFTMKERIYRVIPKVGTSMIKCKDVEKIIFNGNDNYIYENTHVTCHMPVNVYCEVNAVYEVKMSENAIDIKINPR